VLNRVCGGTFFLSFVEPLWRPGVPLEIARLGECDHTTPERSGRLKSSDSALKLLSQFRRRPPGARESPPVPYVCRN